MSGRSQQEQLLLIVMIYLILGILYEDFIHPLTILSGLPSAGFGALLTLLIFQVELNLYSFIGIILLVGIVKKNGIMLVDFAIERQRNANKTPLEAIHEACIVRFHPLIMLFFTPTRKHGVKKCTSKTTLNFHHKTTPKNQSSI